MMSKILAGLMAASLALPVAAMADQATAPQVTMEAGKGAKATNTVERRATITAIDAAKRLVTVKGEGGESFDIEASPEVKNFDKLKVGDVVVATYTESLALRMAKPGEAATPGLKETTTATPGKGVAGGGGGKVGHEVTATLKVEAVDAKANKVTLGDGAGRSRTIDVVNPQVQERLKTIKVGEMVIVTYTQSLAIRLEPVAAKK
jgi:hypothetical protein